MKSKAKLLKRLCKDYVIQYLDLEELNIEVMTLIYKTLLKNRYNSVEDFNLECDSNIKELVFDMYAKEEFLYSLPKDVARSILKCNYYFHKIWEEMEIVPELEYLVEYSCNDVTTTDIRNYNLYRTQSVSITNIVNIGGEEITLEECLPSGDLNSIENQHYIKLANELYR